MQYFYIYNHKYIHIQCFRKTYIHFNNTFKSYSKINLKIRYKDNEGIT